MPTHYGQDAQTAKVQALVAKKNELESALPFVDDNKAAQIGARLDKIEIQLQREIQRAQAIGNEAALASALGIDGMGGLDFQVQSPAGEGRLVKLPFYPEETLPAGYTSGAGTTGASTDVPVIGAVIPLQYGTQLASFTMKTPQISWALLRLVGFEIEIHNAQTTAPSVRQSIGIATGAATQPITQGVVAHGANAVSAPKIVVKDLIIGGGATLFTHENFADGGIYSSALPEYCGLRDYPLIKSPNTAQVIVGAMGCGGANGTGTPNTDAGGLATITDGAQQIVFSVNLLCEVLQDDQYGSSIPGPYARGVAMQRRGGSFV